MSHFTVVVVGAGISGLKTASELATNGVESVICLESRDRIGGRLSTKKGLNGSYEFGAAWHHDTLSNGLFLEELQLPEDERADFIFDDEDSIAIVDNEKGRLHVDQLDCLRIEFEKWVELKYYDSLEADDVSYFQLCMEFCFTKKDLLTDAQLLHLPQLLRYMELWHGIDWFKMSGKWSGIEHNGRNALVLHYEKIVKRISEDIIGSIKLNESVSKITKLPDGKYEIVTNKATYTCDYCVVTVPQSILELSCDKHSTEVPRIEFCPPLNAKITSALTEKASYGSLGKVIFEFDQIKWSTQEGRVLTVHEQPCNFVDMVRNNSDFTSFLQGIGEKLARSTSNCWMNPIFFFNMAKRTNTATFVALIQQPITEYVESLSAEEVEAFFEPALNKVLESLGAKNYIKDLEDKLSDPEIPLLKNIMTTSWSSDPYARGAYSACKPGDDPMELVIALTAGQGNIRFAGEHTIMDGAGCAYGAWESGKREARYILESLFTGVSY